MRPLGVEQDFVSEAPTAESLLVGPFSGYIAPTRFRPGRLRPVLRRFACPVPYANGETTAVGCGDVQVDRAELLPRVNRWVSCSIACTAL